MRIENSRNLTLLLSTVLILMANACSKKSDGITQPGGDGAGSISIVATGASQTTKTSAVCSGEISASANAVILERGICYNTTGNPTIADSKIQSGSGIGAFSATLTNLSPFTNYHYRAYYTNSEGTFYSLDKSFYTLHDFTIGQQYQAGTIIYIDSTTQHGLIAAPVAAERVAAWSCNVFLNNCNATAIGTGLMNTNSIFSQCSLDNSAAGICYTMEFGGYDDWFLPSKDELNLVYQHRALIGDLTDDYYWSSSQVDGNLVWIHFFYNGQVTQYPKSIGKRVRPIRKF